MKHPLPLSTREVALILGLSTRQVARLVPDRLEPIARVEGPRGAMFFDPEAVEALAQERSS